MALKAATKLIKPPIHLYGLEGSYVNALFSAASKKNQLKAVEGDLTFFADLYKKDSKLRDFVTNPFVPSSEKTSLASKLKLNDITINFIDALAQYNRMKHLPGIETMFKKTMAATRKELACLVTSAKPLTDAKRKEVEDSLKGFTNKKLLVTYDTDPSLLGGLVVNFNDDHLIDLSIKTKMRLITTALKAI